MGTADVARGGLHGHAVDRWDSRNGCLGPPAVYSVGVSPVLVKEGTYIHGTEAGEQARLATLNALTNKAFTDWLSLRGSEVVLEVGSGLGILAAEVARRVRDGAVYSVERLPEQVATAKGNIGLPNLHVVLADAHDLPFASGSFEVAYARYVLEHVGNPHRVLAEMRRVLRSAGRVFVQENDISLLRLDPDCPAFDRVWRQFGLLQARLGGDAFVGRRLFGLLRAAQFKDIVLSTQPEVHWSGSPGFSPWIENLIGNLRSAARALVAEKLSSAEEIEAAVVELQVLRERDDGAAWFSWNRARGRK